MSDPSTATEAHEQVYGLIVQAAQTEQINITDLEPTPGNVPSPCAWPGVVGMSANPESIQVPVKVYVAASVGLREAQSQVMRFIDALEAPLAENSWPVNWQIDFSAPLDCLVGTLSVDIPRAYL